MGTVIARRAVLAPPDADGAGRRARDRITRAFAAHGIPASRLVLASRLPFDAFLEAFRDADVALDPFPFAGTTTTCQTLWMGVPVVTLRAQATRAGSG